MSFLKQKKRREKSNLFSDKPLTFSLMYREADNYPTDLYYLMDLSMSMLDDKKKLAALGTLLGKRK
jgi:protocadherin alpha